MSATQILLAVVLLITTGTALLGFSSAGLLPTAQASAAVELPVLGTMPPLDGAVSWLDAKPLTPAQLRGKVVVVNFWTYSCINSLRQLPYIRAWAEKYRDQGLVVVGVHAPEFGFERDVGNVRQALRELGIDYPVAVDSEHRIWDAFGNQTWPALYFVDAKGRVRYRKFGEGDYAELEAVIRQLLSESGARDLAREPTTVDARGAEAQADWADLRTPETYTGYARTERFRSPGGVRHDRRHRYALPDGQLGLNQWALAGAWAMGPEATALGEPGGRIVYRFHARDLHLVMGPTRPGRPVRFKVRIGGEPPGDAHGGDVDSQGNGVVTEPRMYQLIRQSQPIVDRQFEIEFLDPGVETYSFTFG